MVVFIRMVTFLRFIFCITMALITLVEMVHSMAYDVGKLKTKMTKMKSTLTRHNTKEQSKVSAQVLLPKFLDKAKNAVGRLHEDEYTNGYATFELLVRRAQTGPWYRYQDLLGTTVTNDYVENVVLGGLEAEAWRMKLDNWISLQIFGKGTGIESMNKVKDTLVQFKKLKPREFEFGYRIAVDGETVYSVEKSMKEELFIPKSRSPSMARIDIPRIIADAKKLVSESLLSSNDPKEKVIKKNPLILLESQIRKVTEILDTYETGEMETQIKVEKMVETVGDVIIENEENSISKLNEVILQFYDKMIINEADGCIFFSDGSATLSEDGLGFATACCGVFLLPTKKNIPLFTISESIRVDSAGGMMDSPFDAELIAGLSAVTLAKLLGEIITMKNKEEIVGRGDFEQKEDSENIFTTLPIVESSQTNDVSFTDKNNKEKKELNTFKNDVNSNSNDDSNSNNIVLSDVSNTEESNIPVQYIKNKIDFTLHTDSKTLCRAIRTGPKGDLADRASPSRLAMWKLLSSHMFELKSLGLPVTVEWIPGHPERRDMDRNRWTVRDIGIWMADEIAKIETNTVIAGFINNKKADSNNNKLEVRDPERQAKFPKKVTLKSPKKSGVKKKNYYNTKLSFSKDPKNPNFVAAAVELAGYNAVLSAGENIAAEINAELADLDSNDVEGSVEVETEGGDGDDSASSRGNMAVDQIEIDEDNNNVRKNNVDEVEEEQEVEEEEDKIKVEEIIGYEMEDVKILEVTEREEIQHEEEKEEEAVITMSVSIMSAVDMIKLSTLLSVENMKYYE